MSATKLLSIVSVTLLAVLCLIWEGAAQDSASAAATAAPKKMDPAAAKVWNSPQMIQARKWLNDYIRVSAKITPEEGAEYKRELEGLSATQMKLWLLKFEHEQQMQQQQQHAWQQAHQASLQHAMAYQQAAKQALSSVSQGETAAAMEGEKQLQVEQQRAAEMQQSKLDDLNAPPTWGAGGWFNPWGGPYGGYGGVHYHMHLYPDGP